MGTPSPTFVCQGFSDPLVILSPNTQALAGSFSHFYLAATTSEQGKQLPAPQAPPAHLWHLQKMLPFLSH